MILAFVNQKGGVGKTTTCLNVGAGLAKAGYKVLLIDTDPQYNLTTSAGIDTAEGATIYDVLKGKVSAAEVIHKGAYDILPADIMLSGADIELAAIPGRDQLLKEAIEDISSDYDYILIDCPPSLSVITIMSLTAADGVIVPVQSQYLALNGIKLLTDTIKLIHKRMNPKLEIFGIVSTMHDNRLILHQECRQALKDAFPGKLFDTTISNAVALGEAPSAGKDIFAYKATCKAAKQYEALTREIIDRRTEQ